MARAYQGDPDGQHAIVVVPSLTFDMELLARVPGIAHYEERLLAMLLQLRHPRVLLVFVTSLPIADEIVDYYLGMIPGVPVPQARARLTMVTCDDPRPMPLTAKLLAHPEALARIRAAIAPAQAVGLVTNNTTGLERELAATLGVPLLGNPPGLDELGTKSGSRETFREAGVDLPDGYERLRDMSDVVSALAELKRAKPGLQRAVVKLEDGFSGEGNAVFSYLDAGPERIGSVLAAQLRFQAAGETFDSYFAQFTKMGGIVEEFLPQVSASPSGQAYIDPWGKLRPISTHDQVLGGEDGQVFLGSTFPAHERYRARVQEATLAVGEVLRRRGARGRFAVDFVESGDRLPAIEVNLRKGGTTHSMLALALVSDGRFRADGTTFETGTGQPRGYYATDNLSSPAYRGLTPADVINAVADSGLAYDPGVQRGCILHLMGALPGHGKLGVTCIDVDVAAAAGQYRRLVRVLDELAAGSASPVP